MLWHIFRLLFGAIIGAMTQKKVIIYSLYDHSARLIEGVLSNMGCWVTRCKTSEQMIALCRSANPSLVIILNSSLLINGSELIRDIRPNTKHEPLIYVISWQQSEQVVLSLLEIGVDQYMTFPICLHRLKAKAAKMLNIELP